MSRTPVAVLILAVLGASWGACTYGHEENSGVFKPLVFPGEARAGASAFMVIDTNDNLLGDDLERYDLYRDRVEIRVEGNLATVFVTPRSVFAIEAGRATIDAEARPNGWAMVAFFDLPDEGVFSPPYPIHAPLTLEVDGDPVPEYEGVIWIVGEGGSPTSMDAMPLLPFLEDELEPRTMVRLRATGQGLEGFDPSWVIGGIQAEIHYDPTCLSNPRAHLGSDAIGGGGIVGPSSAAPAAYPGLQSAQLLVSHPRGFQLASASTLDPSRLGTGPIVDIAFDRDEICAGTLDQYFSIRALEVHALEVVETNSTLLVSRPLPSEGTVSEGTTFDASTFFSFHYVDPSP